MMNEYRTITKNLDETRYLGNRLGDLIKNKGILICLYGDIGAGKTTFVKSLAEKLGIKEKITSPSFVILNEYHTNFVDLYHFDLYRLEEQGVKSILNELHEYTEDENSIAIIEWAEFSSGDLPAERMEINIKYLEETQREFTIRSYGHKYEKIVCKLQENTNLI